MPIALNVPVAFWSPLWIALGQRIDPPAHEDHICRCKRSGARDLEQREVCRCADRDDHCSAIDASLEKIKRSACWRGKARNRPRPVSPFICRRRVATLFGEGRPGTCCYWNLASACQLKEVRGAARTRVILVEVGREDGYLNVG